MNQPAAPRPNPPRPDDPLAVHEARLSNGLTVLISPNPEQPRVAVQVVVKAGASQEPRDQTGLAHYLEHMLANKGSERLGTIDYAAEEEGLARIARLYDALGEAPAEQRPALAAEIASVSAELAPLAIPNELKQLHGRLGSQRLNAFTSPDQTSYVVELPAGRLAAWALVDGDRFAAPVFRSFQTEVETVCEEKKRALDNPDKQLYKAFMEVLYAGHPYADPVLGRSEHLEAPSPRAMEAFFRRWYVPANMAIVLSGDVDPGEALALVEEHFGGIQSTDPGPWFVEPPPLPEGTSRLAVQHRAPPSLRIAWRTVAAGHPDELALGLLDQVLDNDSIGPLDALVLSETVRSAGCWHRSRRQGGVFCVYGRPRVGQSLDELEALLLERIEALRSGELDPDLVRAVQRNLSVDEQVGHEDNRARAQSIADAWLHGRDPRGTGVRAAARQALTAEDVVAVAKRWLGPDRVIVHRTEGEPSVERAPRTVPLPALPPGAPGHSALYHEALAAPTSTPALRTLEEGRDYRWLREDGLDVLWGPNPHNSLVRSTLRWPLGWDGQPGLDVAVRLAGKAGAGGRDRRGFERALYELAGTSDLSVGRWTTELVVTAPADTIDAVQSLACERLFAPRVDLDEARAAIQDLIERREQARSLRQHAVSALAAFAARGTSSAYLNRPRRAELVALAEEDPALRTGALSELARVALVTGAVAPESWASRVGRGSREGAPVPVLDYVRPDGDRVLLLHHDSVQAQVTVYSPLDGFDPGDYGPRRLWSEAMGGAAGLVFQEVREKRGMAYSAQAGIASGWRAGDANLLWMRVESEVSKAAKATELLLRLLRTFPVDAARLARVRASTLAARETNRIGFRSVPHTILDWHEKGVFEDPLAMHLRMLADTPDDAVRAWARDVGGRPVTVSIVADLRALDRDALAALAPITELTLDDLEVL